jgi:polar amino acid transport system substrate-binding protein
MEFAHMYPLLRTLLVAAMVVLLGLAGCAHNGASAVSDSTADAAAVAALAPTGALRVGVYQGSPTSLLRDPKTHQDIGLAHDLGAALGQRLGVPVVYVEFNRVAEVLEGLKAGTVDLTFTNASPSRVRDVDFTPYLLQLELGVLVPAQSAHMVFADVDRPGVRIGVTQVDCPAPAYWQTGGAPRVWPLRCPRGVRRAWPT